MSNARDLSLRRLQSRKKEREKRMASREKDSAFRDLRASYTIRDFENLGWSSRCPLCLFRFGPSLDDSVNFLSLSLSFFFFFFFLLFVRRDSPPTNRALSYLRELRNDAVIIKNGLIGRREWPLSLSCFCRPSDEDVPLSRYNLVGRIWKVPVVSREVKIHKCSLISQHYAISNET